MLIFIAHGSRNPNWRASIEEMIKPLQRQFGENRVHLAYMECSPPTLQDVAECAIRDGAQKLSIVPLFLTNEGHVDRDIRPVVNRIQADNDTIAVELLPPVGHHELFGKLLREMADQSITRR